MADEGLRLVYTMDGAVEIRIGDFVYVRVNYDYRYTDNARRAKLANDIFDLIKEG